MATLKKIIAIDFNDTTSVRSLFCEFFQTVIKQKKELLSCVIITSTFKKQKMKW